MYVTNSSFISHFYVTSGLDVSYRLINDKQHKTKKNRLPHVIWPRFVLWLFSFLFFFFECVKSNGSLQFNRHHYFFGVSWQTRLVLSSRYFLKEKDMSLDFHNKFNCVDPFFFFFLLIYGLILHWWSNVNIFSACCPQSVMFLFSGRFNRYIFRSSSGDFTWIVYGNKTKEDTENNFIKQATIQNGETNILFVIMLAHLNIFLKWTQ